MRPALSLKTLYRSPVRTVLTFILLAAVTFALFSQVMEYSVAKREMKKAVELYDGVGSIEFSQFTQNEETIQPFYIFGDERVPQGALPDGMYEEFSKYGYESLTKEQIEAISQLPYISYTDTRYMTSGVSDMMRMSVESYYDFNTVCIFEGEVKNFGLANQILVVGDLELIGGEPIPISDFGNADVAIQRDPFARAQGLVFEINEDKTAKYSWGGEEVDFKIGERYVFVTRYWKSVFPRPDMFSYYLTDTFAYTQCEAVYALEGEPENYMETEKFAPLREYVELVEADQHTLDVVYTKNMNSIRYFANGTFGISEGRALNLKDTENKNNVCVIHHDLALENGLSVGDKITVDLGNVLFEQNSAIGAVAVVEERFSKEYTTAELEIVGIYKNVTNKYGEREENAHGWSYNLNTVFVPQHLLSADTEGRETYPGEFSYVVENAWDIPAFKEEVLPQIEEMGFTVYFEDAGFGDILTAFRETERIALIKIVILLFAIVVITWFVAMLYIVGRRRDFAVMRLLGTSKVKASGSLLLPLGVIAIVAVIIGSAAAYVYTAQNIASNASLAVLSGFEIDLSIPLWVILTCILGEIALTVLLAYMLLGIIGRKSPLELMQANTQQGKKKRRKKKKDYAPEPKEPVVLGEWVSIGKLTPDGKDRSFKFAWNYAVRHIRRTLGKALMFIIVTVLLINVAGQLLIMKQTYTDMFEGTEVESQFAGFLNLSYTDELIKSGYVRDVYYAMEKQLEINRQTQTVYICNDIHRYGRENGLENVQVTYLDGYSEEDIYTLGNVIVIGEDLMRSYKYELGDTVLVGRGGWYLNVVRDIIRSFRMSTLDGDKYTDNKIIRMKEDEIKKQYMTNGTEAVIIGSVSDAQGSLNEVAFMPGTADMSSHFGKLVIPPKVSATLADNWKVEEYREYGTSIAGKNLTGEIAFIMDTSKIENIRNNIELMNTLYPIMIAAVMVIGAFLCGMLIIQNSKDIAIMRVLGTSKRRVRVIMVIEHMILCVIGIILAAIVLYVRGVLSQMLWIEVLYAVVIFAASYIASVAASRKNVLELLQTKE